MLHPDGRVEVFPDRVGSRSGSIRAGSWPEHRHVLPVDSTLVLYTDGLRERYADAGGRARSTDGRTAGGRLGARDLDDGLAHLTALPADSAHLDLEPLCDRVRCAIGSWPRWCPRDERPTTSPSSRSAPTPRTGPARRRRGSTSCVTTGVSR